MRDLFGVALEAPVSAPGATPHHLRIPRHRVPAVPDISNAGSGTLQVLLILAFFHARRASVVLLDEPDAHQHVVLQKQVYERIRKASAARKGQLIVATHSEVLLDATDPENVVGFFASGPRPLADHRDRTGLQRFFVGSRQRNCCGPVSVAQSFMSRAERRVHPPRMGTILTTRHKAFSKEQTPIGSSAATSTKPEPLQTLRRQLRTCRASACSTGTTRKLPKTKPSKGSPCCGGIGMKSRTTCSIPTRSVVSSAGHCRAY